MNYSTGSKIYTIMAIRSLTDTTTMVSQSPSRAAKSCATFSQPLSLPALVSTPRLILTV